MKKIVAFTDRLRLRIAPPIAADTARCEFECRRLDCTFSRYESCERRQQAAHEIRQFSNAADC